MIFATSPLRHISTSLAIYCQRPILLQFLLGIPSGLPLALTASTLTYWLSESGVDKAAIGIFAMVAMPYAFKFLWAPMMDGITLPGGTAEAGQSVLP
jgi:PAT family beta-lactamase induction signal transducer AmpG